VATRRADVASALRGASGRALSGEALARDLGISRTAVAKHVASLRSLGYAIEAAPGVGYWLVSAPDACIPEEVWPRLGDLLWVECTGGPQTRSTNDDAKRLAQAGAGEGTIVIAGRQSGGRGRFGRTWASPEGGVYASVVLRPPLAPSELAPVALVVAVGVARGLAGLGCEVGLKWPNDVLLGGRKLAGILVETAAEVDCVEWVVAGIGVNVAGAAYADGACVRDAVPEAAIADVAAAVLDAVAGAYRVFCSGGFAAVREEYLALGTLWGRQVLVHDSLGRRVADGVAQGVDDAGALLISGDSGTLAVMAGEVTLADTHEPLTER